jgi:molybdate transport system substrate-binding protein
MTPTRRKVLALLPAAVTMWPRDGARAAGSVLVAVASNLTPVFPKLQAAFEGRGGVRLSPVFGATGTFANQIRQGAPFELLLGADEAVVAALHADGTVAQAGVPYAKGRLSLVAGRRSSFADGIDRPLLAAALASGRSFRMAIGNPEHAPYGAAAVEIIARWGLTEALRGRLVYGNTVAHALQYVASGAIETGIVASSLLTDAAAGASVVASRVSPQDHRPLLQTLVLTNRAGAAARDFAMFMVSDTARRVLRDSGFGIPGETA